MEVVGAYNHRAGGVWQAATGEASGRLFKAVVGDDAGALEQLLDAEPSLTREPLAFLYADEAGSDGNEEPTGAGLDGARGACDQSKGRGQIQVKQRTLVAIAAYHGSVRALSLLIARGASSDSLSSPEGWSPKQV